MIECDRSKWLARWKVDQSTPQMQSIWTLLIDKLLYRALLNFKENVEKMLYLVMLTAHLSVTLKCLTKVQAQSSFTSIYSNMVVNTTHTTLLKNQSATKYLP